MANPVEIVRAGETSGISLTNPLPVGGPAVDDAAASGNPVPVGGKYNATLPTYTDGDRTQIQAGSRGSLHTTVFGADSTTSAAVATPADAQTNSAGMVVSARNSVHNGSTWDRQRGNTTGTFVIPPAPWNYAAATGGIDNTTTAVTVKTAAGASVKNYITEIQIAHATLGASTEFAIRDGAGGTVLWRTLLHTTAMPTTSFKVHLAGTANTLLEVVTLTAVTGDVLINLQGYTGP